MTRPLERFATPIPEIPPEVPIIGVSVAIRRAVGLAMRFAPTDIPILLVGATGTGKELFARQIHEWSRRAGPLVDVNAGALPREMVESLLFGHRRGAFTGAVEEGRGLIRSATGGTLFLDELASLPPEGQAKLLRVLENGVVRRLGDLTSEEVRCRFVAAVQDDVEARVEAGDLRLDLYQRIAGIVIHLPPLAERPEDVLPMARAFAEKQGCRLLPEAETALVEHKWSGNVRELKSAVQRAAFLASDRVVDGDTMHEAVALGRVAQRPPGKRTAQDGEVSARLLDLCRTHEWDVGRAARALGVGRSTLYRRLQRVGIDPSLWRLLGPGVRPDHRTG